MKKRIMAIVLCFVTVLTSVSAGFINFSASSAFPPLAIYYENEKIESINIPQNDKKTVTAISEDARDYEYRWQFLVDVNEDLWVDVYAQNSNELTLSYALLLSAIDNNGSVYLRVAAETDNGTVYSEPVYVTVTPSTEFAPLAEQETQPFRAAKAVPYALAASEEAPLAEEDVRIIINYLDAETGNEMYTSYSVLLKKGEVSTYKQTVLSPTWLGYAPKYYAADPTIGYQDAALATDDASEIIIDIAVNADTPSEIVYNIYYKASEVPYAAKYFYQNLYDDMYSEDADRFFRSQALTGTIIDDATLNAVGDKEGFSALYHYPEAVAADGSTVFECYYDRNYYLMKFDMDGGYGTDPIYARFDTPFLVNEPNRPGYKFVGWDLLDENGNGDGVPEEPMPSNIPAENRSYKAIWTKTETNYTIIYWRENADDDGYSFWGYKQIGAFAEDTVVVDDNPRGAVGVDNNEIQYFTYNPEKSEKAVTVNGDGSTVANVYFTRNVYTVLFYKTETGYSDNLCGLEEHTHTPECKQLVCTLEEHTHTEACYGCGLEAHTHDYTCCSIVVHTHNSACCNIKEHTHGPACCQVEYHTHENCKLTNCPHTHSINCYATSTPPLASNQSNQIQGYLTNIKNNYPNPISGNIYRYVAGNGNGGTHNFFYFNGTWYYLGAGKNDNSALGYGVSPQGDLAVPKNQTYGTAPATINCTHTHTDSCYDCGKTFHDHTGGDCVYCDTPEHTHGDGTCNYTCGMKEHTHDGVSCVYDACGKEEHTHNQGCLTCGIPEHTHDDAKCYIYTCGDTGHTHTAACKRNAAGTTVNNARIIYTIKAKYEQDISNQWPTADKVQQYAPSGQKLQDWTIPTLSSPQASKMLNMTAGLCNNANNRVDTASANWTTATKTWDLKYYFESFDQTSPANGTTRRLWNDKYYDIDDRYTQTLYHSATSWGAKEVLGFTPASSHDVHNGTDSAYANFFYNRNSYSLSFKNFDTVVKDVTMLYKQPLTGMDFVPPYPDGLEPNSYTFGGWYMTEACIPGTECDFNTEKMPAGNLMLYAKWLPVKHTVNFFLNEDDMNSFIAGNDSVDYQSRLVDHGNVVVDITNPVNPDKNVKFAGWFYYENGNKKAYTPLDFPVTKDINVFAEWSSQVAQPYKIEYVLLEDPSVKVADDTFGFAWQGTTRTFSAKAGDPFNQLYSQYNSGYFPTVAAHSITMQPDNAARPMFNVYTFYYVKVPSVPYTVRYVDAKTGQPLAEDKIVMDNQHSVVTERFKPISGYVPDNFYKRIVLQYDKDNTTPENNVITFYYTKNDAVSPYAVHYMLQNLGTTGDNRNLPGQPGDYFESSTRTEGVTDKLTLDIVPPDFVGYNVDSIAREFLMDNNGVETEKSLTLNGGRFVIEISKNGTDVYIYYRLKEFKYTVEYRDYNNPDVHLAPDKVVPNNQFGAEVTEKAIDIPGYNCVSVPPEITITISNNEGNNVITFWYTKLQYVVEYKAWTPGGGTVDMAIETVEEKNFMGSVPAANAGYVFAGWYKDAECTIPVDSDWVGAGDRLTPQKDGINPVPEKNVFYAKFTPTVGSLTIVRENAGNEGNGDQTFVYKVTNNNTGDTVYATITGEGSTTIHQLPAGSYTVEQVNDWSWRFEDGQKPTTVVSGQNETVVFNEAAKKVYWLNGNSNPVKNVKGAE